MFDQIEKEQLLHDIYGDTLEEKINSYCNTTTLNHQSPSLMEKDYQVLKPGDALDRADIYTYMENKLNLPSLISEDQFFL